MRNIKLEVLKKRRVYVIGMAPTVNPLNVSLPNLAFEHRSFLTLAAPKPRERLALLGILAALPIIQATELQLSQARVVHSKRNN
jgi:hypothetical protein